MPFSRRQSAGHQGRRAFTTPFGVEACRPALDRIIDYTVQQRLIPRRFTVNELFDDTTRKMN